MTEITISGQPIFVDVLTPDAANNMQVQTYPISELQSFINVNTEAKAVDEEQPNDDKQDELTENQDQPEQPTQPDQTPQEKSTKKRSSNEKHRIKCPLAPECRFTGENEEKLTQHLRRHRGENAFQCHICDYSTYNKSLFEEHIRIHQGIKPFKCSFCNYRSASKKNTKKHEQIHSPSNPRKCDQCDFVARHLKGLAAHKLGHLKDEELITEKDLFCSRCSFQCITKEEYKNHIKNHRKCLVCGTYVESRTKLQQHNASEHGYKRKRKPSANNPANHDFHCEYCLWSSSTKSRILLHLIHHPNQTVDESIIDVSILRKYGIMK